jgi:hypothetical protein
MAMALLYFAAVLMSEYGQGSPAVMRRQQVRQSDRGSATSAIVVTSAIEVSFCAPTALKGSLCLPQVFDSLVETLGARG